MPVKVWHLVAEQFVIQLVRPKTIGDGRGQQAHFAEVGMTLGITQLMQFPRMTSCNQDTVTMIILPGTKERDGVRELPDNVFRRQFAEPGKLQTKRTTASREIFHDSGSLDP